MENYKVVTVRVKDNTEKIEAIRTARGVTEKAKEEMLREINAMQTLGLMQVLAYIKCAYEDYKAIVGKDTVLEVNCVRLWISARESQIRISFYYIGAPLPIVADIKNGNIVISVSSREGIKEVMQTWGSIKSRIQEEIDETYAKKIKAMESELSDLTSTLDVAKNFRA